MSEPTPDRPVVDIVQGDAAAPVVPLGTRTTTVRIHSMKRTAAAVSLGPGHFTAGATLASEAYPWLASVLAQARETQGARLLVAGHGPDAEVARARADATWRALSETGVEEVDRALCAALGVDALGLSAFREAARPAKCAAVGCGAAWAPAAVRMPGLVPAGPERVDVLVFTEADAPVLDCHAGDACTPNKCDVYRKAKYKAVMLEAPPPGKAVHVLELPEPDCFLLAQGEHVKDGTVLVPGQPGDPAALKGLGLALRWLGGGPGRKALVVAHSPTAKDATSQLRAESVLAYLRGRDAWAEHARKNAQPADWQHALKWIAIDRGWPKVDPGKADGLAYGGSQAALREFRTRYKEAFGTWVQSSSTSPGLADWKAFFDVFDARLKELLEADPAPLRAALTPLEPGAVACGAAWPAEKVDVHHWLGTRPDRLEVLGFDEQDAPADLAAPLAGVYSGRAYRAEYFDPALAAHVLHVKVVDEKDQPVTGVDYEARLGPKVVRQGPLSAQGDFKAVVAPGTYDVRILRPIQPAPEAEPWQGGDGSLEALLRGDYQRRGSYRGDMSGFKNPDLQRFLAQACATAGVDGQALEERSATAGTTGDSEQGSRQGLPQWLRAFQTKAMGASGWGTQEQMMSRLLGAFYFAHFVETFYAPAGVAMPANVEYFLEHLGMSTGNGAATMENLSASAEADRAAASSKCYLEGLSRYGWSTTALGFAPGAPPRSGHGCKVKVTEGRKAGAENRPLPGDVLSVRTAIGPLSGHVVTVVWADTDGTKSGQMWYVSGNAACRSVSCDFVRVEDVAGRPQRGGIAVINRCTNGELQPDHLASLSEGDLEARGCKRAAGTFPGANQPGKVAPSPPAGPAAADLLASGQADASPIEAGAPPVVLKAELRIAMFSGSREGATEPAGDTVHVVPGCKVKLEWLAQGYDKVVLQPGDQDVTEATRAGTPWVTLSPAERAPGEGGKYRLEVSSGARTVTAEVALRGIVDFKVSGLPPDDPKKKKPELLERIMAGKKYGTPGFTAADVVHGLPGSFRAYTSQTNQDFQSWWWGQITPKADAVLEWKIAWPSAPTVTLTVNRKSGSMKPLETQDATALTSARDGLWAGRFEAITEKKYRTFFEADLGVVEGAAEVEQATIRLRENYEMPGIASFTVLVGGAAIGDGASIARDSFPVLSWELKGDHSGNGLRGEVADATGRSLLLVPIREWVRDGEAKTPAHKAATGTQAISEKFQDGPDGEEARLHLELFNRFGRVERKTVKVKLTGQGVPPPPGGPTRIRLFDAQGAAMPKAAYELRDPGGAVLKKGAADASGYLDGEGLPAEVRLAWGPGLKNERTIKIDVASSGDDARLHNLGYPAGLEDRVLLFQQRTGGLATTGSLDAETRRMLQTVHDSGAETRLAK